jgi:hypothetical protein
MKKTELQIFQEYCDFWIKKLGLIDWDYRCTMSNKPDNANVLLNPEGRKAYIGLCTKRESCISIEQLAAHEILEILLADMALLLQKYYSDDLVADEVHKVINRLMPLLMEFKP